MGLATLALSLLAAQAAPSPGAVPTEAAVSWAEARSFAQKLEQLEQLERGSRPGARPAQRPMVVTEGELNSYLNLSLGDKMPAGLADVKLALDSDRIAARAVVDLERVRGRAPASGPWSPLSYLSGRVPLEVRGRYRNAQEGFGALEVEQILLASFPVPVSLLEQLVSAASPRDEGRRIDIQAPFRLPYAAKRLRVQKGQARLEF
jgi:hypothetical protein